MLLDTLVLSTWSGALSVFLYLSSVRIFSQSRQGEAGKDKRNLRRLHANPRLFPFHQSPANHANQISVLWDRYFVPAGKKHEILFVLADMLVYFTRVQILPLDVPLSSLLSLLPQYITIHCHSISSPKGIYGHLEKNLFQHYCH